jgi:hypothetical protein
MFDMKNYRCVTQAGEERMLSEKSSIFILNFWELNPMKNN